jgi:hypothetical protein
MIKKDARSSGPVSFSAEFAWKAVTLVRAGRHSSFVQAPYCQLHRETDGAGSDTSRLSRFSHGLSVSGTRVDQ